MTACLVTLAGLRSAKSMETLRKPAASPGGFSAFWDHRGSFAHRLARLGSDVGGRKRGHPAQGLVDIH